MLSEEDYKDYIRQILQVENIMANVYQECADQVEDEELRSLFCHLVASEKEHAWNVAKLAGYFSGK